MKKIINVFASALMLSLTIQLSAQHPKEIKNKEVEGLYLSLADFKLGKLTIPIDKKHKGDKIKLKQFFISPYIKSIEEDKEEIFYKDSIFAIRLNNGENYRFINRTPCLVADTSNLYIYTNRNTKTEYKKSGPRFISKEVPITYYYFSTGNQNVVFMLTLANLRKYALSDTLLHITVCDKFTNDEMLSEINSKTGRFVLNEAILSLAKK